jgi:hypothetical protein
MESDQDHQTWKITMKDITETERDVGWLESDKTSNMETNQLSW